MNGKLLRPQPTNVYEKFRLDLERESPRAAYWLEAMIFSLMAQVDDMTEDRALELACKIVAGPTNPSQATQRAGRRVIAERMPRNTPAASHA